ncbi:MAG: hypothetical protein NUV59_00860 [Patescibacteria group bacterium]|nr:hypothetical protein [Patescibacteria group bacterium]
MSCSWEYTITGVQRPENVSVDILGTTLTLTPRTSELEALRAEGGITFECENTREDASESELDKCDSAIAGIDLDVLPPCTLADFSDLYDLPEPIPGALGAAGIEITQPSIIGGAEVKHAVTLNRGKCLFVVLLAHVEVTPGKISYTFSGHSVHLEFGSAYSDTFIAKYKLCCCEYDEGLPVVTEEEIEAGKVMEGKPDRVGEVGNGLCGTGCIYRYLDAQNTNPASPIAWNINAPEGECDFEAVLMKPPPTSSLHHTTKRKQNDKVRADRP